MTTVEQISSCLYNKFGIEVHNSNATLVHDLNMDSLDIVELFMEIEKVYGITIPDFKWEDFGMMTVARLAGYVDGVGGKFDRKASTYFSEYEGLKDQKNNLEQNNAVQGNLAPAQNTFKDLKDQKNNLEQNNAVQSNPAPAQNTFKDLKDQKNNLEQNNAVQSNPAPAQNTFKGLYAASASGKAKCRLTGRPCQKIKPDEIAKNTQLLNLCRQHKCNIENNFQKIMQEHTK